MLCNSSTRSRRPLVFAFNSLTECSAKPFPELSPFHDDFYAFTSKFFSNLSLQSKYGVFTIAT
eukprot:181992-Amphidinium_carterae.1